MATKKTGKDLAKPATTHPVAFDEELLRDAGSGFEDMRENDFKIPLVTMLQNNSPQINEVDEARGGMWFNSVDGTVSETIKVVPCAWQKKWMEWRDNQGGLVAAHVIKPAGVERRADSQGREQEFLSEDTYIVETAYWYCLLVTEGGLQKVVLPFKMTGLTFSRTWASTMRSMTATINGQVITKPSYHRAYVLGKNLRKKDSYSWYVPHLVGSEPVDIPTYKMGKAYNAAVKLGEYTPAEETPEEAETKDSDVI